MGDAVVHVLGRVAVDRHLVRVRVGVGVGVRVRVRVRVGLTQPEPVFGRVAVDGHRP